LLPLARARRAHRGPGGGARRRRHREPHARSLRAGGPPPRMKAAPFEVPRPPRNERAVLVGHAQTERGHLERSLEELALLADTAGAPGGGLLVHRPRPLPPPPLLPEGNGEGP